MDQPVEEVNPMKLMFDIMAMPEYELREQLGGFQTSIYIFQENYLQVEKFIQFMVDPSSPGSPSAFTNREHIGAARREVVRLLHNYVAAAFTLIDHTRRFYRKLYESTGRFSDYNSRCSTEFIGDPLSAFIKDLRHYCQHVKSPVIGVQQKITRREAGFIDERAVYLQHKEMVAYKEWSAAARRYIDSFNGKDIDVLAVAKAYRDKVTHFYQWFEERQAEIHAEELGCLYQMEAQFEAANVEASMNLCLSNLNNPEIDYCHEQNVFFPVSSNEFIHELEKVGSDPSKRAARAIQLLQSRFAVSDRLREKVERYYREYWLLNSQ